MVCLTAPFAGIVIGGSFFSYCGGYNDPKSFKFAVYILGSGMVLAVVITAASEKWLVYSSLWFLFFIGAFTLPTLTGIMLNSIEEHQKTTGNSLATLL